MLGKLLSIVLAVVMVGVMVVAGMAQSPPTVTKQTGKVEGWVQIQGGGPIVFLRPGLDAYEHNTGLVRDLRTGQRSRPITPQSVAPRPAAPPTYFLTPVSPSQPYYQPRSPYPLPSPYAVNPYAVNPYQQPWYQQPWYDVGPGNVYGPNNVPCDNCGSKIGAPGAINSRWQQTKVPK